MAEEKRPPKPLLPKLVGSATAFAALSVAVVLKFDAYDTVFRAILAYMAGHFCGAVWDAIFGRRESQIDTVSVNYEVLQPSESRHETEAESTDESDQEAA